MRQAGSWGHPAPRYPGAPVGPDLQVIPGHARGIRRCSRNHNKYPRSCLTWACALSQAMEIATDEIVNPTITPFRVCHSCRYCRSQFLKLMKYVELKNISSASDLLSHGNCGVVVINNVPLCPSKCHIIIALAGAAAIVYSMSVGVLMFTFSRTSGTTAGQVASPCVLFLRFNKY